MHLIGLFVLAVCCPCSFLEKSHQKAIYIKFSCAKMILAVVKSGTPEDGGNKVIVIPISTLEIVPAPSDGLTTRGAEYSAHSVLIQCDKYGEAREKWINENNVNYRQVLGQVNGAPTWLQGDETPNCSQCDAPMEFLAQLEEGPDSSHRNELW